MSLIVQFQCLFYSFLFGFVMTGVYHIMNRLLYGVPTVSYTHLDVYKRQWLWCHEKIVEKEVVFVYCHHCGKVVQEDMQYCPNCGYPLQNSPYVYHEKDAPSFLFALISFFAPLVGLVLYIIWRKDFPQKAKAWMNGMKMCIRDRHVWVKEELEIFMV